VHIALAIIITLIITNYIAQFTIVRGNSMLPTLDDNNILVIEKLTQRFGQIKPGDIVVVRIPDLLGRGKTYAVKRVIAPKDRRLKYGTEKCLSTGMNFTNHIPRAAILLQRVNSVILLFLKTAYMYSATTGYPGQARTAGHSAR